MNETIKQRIFAKNQKLADMVIEKAKRDFPDEIALIGLTGSFSTGDFHEKSDLDLIIVNNTDKGWEIGDCFILDDVGYDVYCTPWEKLEEAARAETVWMALLVDLEVLYVADSKHLERFNELKEKALKILAQPVSEAHVKRAEKHLNLAKQAYAEMMLSSEIGHVRFLSSYLIYHVFNGIVALNNTYMKGGFKRHLKDLMAYDYLPEQLDQLYMEIIEAKTVGLIRSHSLSFLKSFTQLYEEMKRAQMIEKMPTFENLKGTYEELWSNYRNKIIKSTSENDKYCAFDAASNAQNFFDSMTDYVGTPQFNLMKHFDADHLDAFRETFLEMMEEYRQEYDKVGRQVRQFDSFDELYQQFMDVKKS